MLRIVNRYGAHDVTCTPRIAGQSNSTFERCSTESLASVSRQMAGLTCGICSSVPSIMHPLSHVEGYSSTDQLVTTRPKISARQANNGRQTVDRPYRYDRTMSARKQTEILFSQARNAKIPNSAKWHLLSLRTVFCFQQIYICIHSSKRAAAKVSQYSQQGSFKLWIGGMWDFSLINNKR